MARRSTRLGLEALEGREVPATTFAPGIYFENGIVTVLGSDSADTIRIDRSGSSLKVSFSSSSQSASKSYDTGKVSMVFVDGGKGGDVITVTEKVTTKARLFGGYGGDIVITGGAGNDDIYGGEGSDVLKGGSGRDTLFGGAGDDTINGGADRDYGNGGGGKDNVVAEMQATGAESVSLDAMAQKVFDLTNAARARNGLPALKSSSALSLAAIRQINGRILLGNRAEHTLLGYEAATVASRIDETGFEFTSASENITSNTGYADPAKKAVDWWMNSAGHKANILSTNHTHMGVAWGKIGNTYVFTQVFARPA